TVPAITSGFSPQRLAGISFGHWRARTRSARFARAHSRRPGCDSPVRPHAFWSDLRGDPFVARHSDPGLWRSAWWQCEYGGKRVSRVSRFSPAVSRAVSVTSELVRRAIPAALRIRTAIEAATVDSGSCTGVMNHT